MNAENNWRRSRGFERLRLRLAQAKHVKWPEAGHLRPLEHAASRADALVDFAKGLDDVE